MVGSIPDHFTGFKGADHALQILTVDHAFIGAHAAVGLNEIDNRVVVWTINTDAGRLHAKHPRPDLQRQKMNPDQQNAGLVSLKRMHGLHAGSRHFAPARHALI